MRSKITRRSCLTEDAIGDVVRARVPAVRRVLAWEHLEHCADCQTLAVNVIERLHGGEPPDVD